MSTQRIVSLLPSATEIVAALGLADQLVGRSHQCDFPAPVEALPVLSATKVNLDGGSRAIDRRVNEIIAQDVSVYRVDADLLRAVEASGVSVGTEVRVVDAAHLRIGDADVALPEAAADAVWLSA